MSRRLVPFVLAAAAVLAPRAALAQDDAESPPARERRIEETIARLRNPFFETDAERVRILAQELAAAGDAKADDALRAALGGTSVHPNVVEQVARAVLADPSLRFLEDVAARLHADSGSELERRLLPLFEHASPAVVDRLCGIAGDLRRGTGLRRTALRLLGRTGDGRALATIAGAWGGADRDLHDEAKEAFDAILPVGVASAAEASAMVERMRREDLSVDEVLRRALRERARATVQPASPHAGAYARMAAELLPSADLDQVIRLFLAGSPVPEVRADAARRLAEFPWDAPKGQSGAPAVRDDDGRRRAFQALMDALGREESGDTEREILRALVALAPHVRGGVRSADVDLAAARVSGGSTSSRDARLLAARLLGEIRDERSLPALEGAFDALRGGDAEMRVALLEAMQSIPADRSEWLAARIGAESHGKVLRKLATLLGRSRDPRAARAFRAMLESHDDPAIRGDAARHLGTMWAGSEVAEARAALLDAGLADRDPSVRTIAVGGLSYPGPGAADLLPRLRDVAKIDVDESVRAAAVKSILDLDLDRAAEHLIPLLGERPELWALWRDRLVTGLGRRETAPTRVLAAAGALADASRRPLAVELLAACADPREGALRDADGLARVRERLTGLLLDEGRPAEAETWARALMASDPAPDAPGADAAALHRHDLLLGRALVASGSAAKRAEAEGRLLAFLGTARLPAPAAAHATVLLGECRILLEDAWGALAALEPELPAEAGETLRRRREILVEDAKRLASADRAKAFELADRLAAADVSAARELAAMGSRAARPLREALLHADEPLRIRRLLAAAEAFGAPKADLTDASTRDQWQDSVRKACEKLESVPRPASKSPDR